MTLSSPHYLWALLLLPLLWWLSQPPRPRQQTFTAHLPQWREALQALRRRPPRGSPLRFMLLALATIAAAFAAARPVWTGNRGPERLVVLLDGSASMAARFGGGPSAFDEARERLRTAFAELPEQVDVTILRSGGDLRRRHGRSARTLHDLGAPAGALAVDLVELAAAAAVDDTVVWTLTDGQGQHQLPVEGALTSLDRRGANAAIVAARVDDAWPLPTLAIELDVVAHAPATAADGRVVMTLTVAGAIEPRAPLVLSVVPGEPTTVPLVLVRTAAGGSVDLTATLPGDRLPVDDRFTLTLPPLPAPRIAVLAEGEAGPFATLAAAALAAEVGGEVVAPDSGEQVGLLLVDGGRAGIEPGVTRALTFGSRLDEREPEPWLGGGGIDWSRAAALTAGLDLSELRVDRAWPSVLPAGEALLWADDGGRRTPLGVVAAGPSGIASVHFAFRLQDSNLPLLAAFPQLLRRAFVRSYGASATTIRRTALPATGEIDLLNRVTAVDRALPAFGGQDRQLARWFVVAGLLALALRAFVR